MENLRNSINVRLVNNEKKLFKYTSRPTHITHKWFVYDFHYNFIKKKIDTELLFTDIDSLTYEIKLEDVYEEFVKHKHLFDLKNYPKDSKIFDPVNEKVIGKMKDMSQ